MSNISQSKSNNNIKSLNISNEIINKDIKNLKNDINNNNNLKVPTSSEGLLKPERNSKINTIDSKESLEG